jgi:rSAM/selenodomain-associated transferase 1
MSTSADSVRRSQAECALAIFAKAPIPGGVKTRLVPPLTAEQAARLHAALVEDTLRRVRSLDMVRYLACAPDIRQSFFRTCARRYSARLITQGPGDLGDRMRRVVTRLLARHRTVLLIGTDSPTLPLEFIQEGERRLDAADLVVGPSDDGGYYLLGQRRLYRSIFYGVTWGGEEVLSETLAKLGSSARISLLPRWYDVDRAEDLSRLRADVAATTDCPETRAWFREWAQQSRSAGASATL